MNNYKPVKYKYFVEIIEPTTDFIAIYFGLVCSTTITVHKQHYTGNPVYLLNVVSDQ